MQNYLRSLAAEKPIAAERNQQKIIVEVKSFLSPSPMRDFQTALLSIYSVSQPN
ncbi:MAG: element excision factor XisH family protein [Microcoleaceae cyanobacterium]